MLTLGDLHIGQDAIIRVVGGEGELRHHLLDMGLTPGTEVTLRKTAPMGDPIEVELRGYELTLRLCNLVRRTEKGRLRRRGWGLRWEKAQKGGKGTNLRGFFED